MLDLTTFRKKLKANQYDGRTGALRAIGKARYMSVKDKDSARKSVYAKYGKK